MQPLNSTDKNPEGFYVLFHMMIDKNSTYPFYKQFPSNSFKIK